MEPTESRELALELRDYLDDLADDWPNPEDYCEDCFWDVDPPNLRRSLAARLQASSLPQARQLGLELAYLGSRPAQGGQSCS